MTTMTTIDDYLATLPAGDRAAYERVVEVALEEAPSAEPGASYGIAALILDGKPLLGLRAGKTHLGLYPFSPAAVETVADRLPASAISKGTVRFTADKPLDEQILRDLVSARVTEIRA